jgi:predicted MFS family arabinose efflux permease
MAAKFLLPQARATLMAGNVAAFAGGRTLGALIGPGLFAVGMAASSAATITMDLIALAALMLFVKVE